MSYWLLCDNGILASRLHCFIEACQRSHVEVLQESSTFRGMDSVAQLRDLMEASGSVAFLVRETEEILKIYGDSDAAYSSLIRRFGPNYAKLMRLYAELVATEQAEANGYSVEERTELENGDLLLVVNA